ncbi:MULTISPECIES: S8 family serine peptidase [unclassified Streptomyces]|uniref:S8 family peptidase n=1 Tax=unclassified Streptomyces TaxID=2593676 RepID=UPI001BEB67E0|nr:MULTISPECIES: S8 family serine peptidase [unclassified Streptomyces]MBT2405153.1 S8 family serine peptidase [Streptomyces sp. ISL-21]MBT2454793.1 S8 family serine peptidase [Streptomyces sp. ISL-86]MBT2610921.1 S8 family serine peptidase [Streptomyces sp. ISL-87]
MLAAAVGAALTFGAPAALAGTAPVAPSAPSVQSAPAKAKAAAPTSQSATWVAGTRAYLVITAPGDSSAVRSAITANGGTVFSNYDSIGVIVAHSASGSFATTMRGVSGVQQVGATRTSDVPADAYNPALPANPTQATTPTGEPVRADMSQIKADQAWAVTTGSSSVKVGILDTGMDDQHQDLAPNFNAADSVSCAYGKADTRTGAWRDVDSHGTHVAGTIAAAKNGKGVIGVAPSVKISAVRVAEPGNSFFFAENTICGFVWAGDHGFKVTNNSYYTDPWQFNCPDNVDQAAIIEGVKRAQAYAESKGSLQVAAAGNENYDLAHKTTDSASPNDSTPTTRTITNACLDIPTELPGVVTVAANGTGTTKASFSNFGQGVIDVAAPGSDVYSTVPGGKYGSKSGTSMATPHVVGVAALLASTNPGITPAQLRDKLATQANDIACPSDSRCTGTTANNAFFGEGQVDALKAVGSTPPAGKYFENLGDFAINDNATVESPITVSGVTGNAPATLKVGVDIKHTYIGDLKVDLVAPDGTVYTVHNRAGGSTDNIIQTFTVDASSEVANGVWKLRVNDNASADTGKIDAWNLTF